MEKGYEGGGNALLIFDGVKLEDVKQAIREFTLHVLAEYPGIELAVAIDEAFGDSKLNAIYDKLKASKNNFIPNTFVPSHGINALCNRTGLSAESYIDKDSYISYSSCIKLRKASEFDNPILKELALNEQCSFTDKLDDLGSKEGEDSHIAFVFIDGNDMSDRFIKLKSLEDKIKLSETLKDAVHESFKCLIRRISAEIEDIKTEIEITDRKQNGKYILPIRPILVGGDDISFVCDGRMAIYFAKIFMESFEKQTVSDEETLTSCAGISIAHAKYPIYRIQKIAEELCSIAKNKRNDKVQKGDDSAKVSSYFDFHIFYSGMSGTVEDVRESDCTTKSEQLYMRPYSIKELDLLAKPIKKLSNVANSKIKKLKSVLNLSEGERKNYLYHMKMRANSNNFNGDGHSFEIPETILEKTYNKDFFIDKKTPYNDLIELLELLPKYAIDRGQL